MLDEVLSKSKSKEAGFVIMDNVKYIFV